MTTNAPVPQEDANVTDVVLMLMGRHRETQASLALATGIPKRTLARRLHGAGWTVAEAAKLAEHYGLPVSRFIAGGDNLLGGDGGGANAR